MGLVFVMNATELRRALEDIQRAEANGLPDCNAVLKIGGVLASRKVYLIFDGLDELKDTVAIQE